MKLKVLILFLAASFFANAQTDINLELIANVSVGQTGNDIWGYKDTNGIEYAIMGSRSKTSIFSLEDPMNPQLRIEIGGSNSTWRDIKSWNNHLYVTTDSGADGLLIVNMTNAPENITFNFWTPELQITSDEPELLEKCHNLYIDEGVCYLAGCNSQQNGGVVILDIETDPENPIQLGVFYERYAHDVFVRNDTMYTSEIYAGEFGIYDISDKSNIQLINRQGTSTDFTHNAWLSDDGNFLFTTDERNNAYVDAYDISDPMNIKFLDNYRPLETEGDGVIPHNTHYSDGFLVTSWYTDGIVVIDGKRAHNLVKVASYDTYLFTDIGDGFSGCWGAFPFLESGYILASDMNSGLYVFEANYPRACWLEGTITDCETGNPINNVSVNILSDDLNREKSDPLGFYATGQVTPGTFDVEYTHPDYAPVTISVSLENDVLTTQDVELCALKSYNITINTVDKATGESLGNTAVVLERFGEVIEKNTDGSGTLNNSYLEGNYKIYAGAWGYLHASTEALIESDTEITLELERGYQDDFFADLGWTTENTSNVGQWVRDEPVGTNFEGGFSNVNTDVEEDLGIKCFVTGNSDQGGAGFDDVDDGFTLLKSPIMDLSTYNEPIVEYRLWFFNDGGAGSEPNDYLSVRINNGIETKELELVTFSEGAWREVSKISLTGFIEITDQMTIEVVTEDLELGHLVEAGFDAFLVTEGMPTSTIDFTELNVQITPNPASEYIDIIGDLSNNASIEIFDTKGSLMIKERMTSARINIASLQTGLYLVNIQDGNSIKTTKLIVE